MILQNVVTITIYVSSHYFIGLVISSATDEREVLGSIPKLGRVLPGVFITNSSVAVT